MAKLPRRPDLEHLRALPPVIVQLPAGTELHRVYFRGGGHPTLWNAFRYFGPTSARFDHQEPGPDGDGQKSDRGVLYCAASALTCLAEVFQGPPRVIQRHRKNPWLVTFELRSAVILLDLSSTFPLQAGASMKLMSGPSSTAQNWSRGFCDAYPDIQGLYYPSSLTNLPTVMLNERARPDMFPPSPVFHRALNDPVMLTPLRNAARELNYGLI